MSRDSLQLPANWNAAWSATLRWGRLLAGFSALQILVQFLSFGAGIQIIRALPKPDYAKYVVAGTAISFVGLLSDLGLSQAVLAVGGQFAAEPARLYRIAAAALRARRILLAAGAVAMVIGYPLVFRQRNWPQAECWIFILISLATAWFQAGYSPRAALLKVQRRFIFCQSVEAGAAAFRCCLMAAVTLVGMTPQNALLANLFVTGLQYVFIASKTPLAWQKDNSQSTEPDERKLLWRFCRPLIASTLYYAFQGQLTIWLLAFFGNSLYLANIGALGRLGQATLLFEVCISSIAVPYFAALVHRRVIVLRFLGYSLMVGIVILALIGSGLAIPQLWLWILGSRYTGLRIELLLMLTSAGEAFATGAFYFISIARRSTRNQWLAIPCSVCGFAVALLIARPTSTRGAITIEIIRQIPVLALQAFLAWRAVSMTVPVPPRHLAEEAVLPA
jgi:hypothetical protein